MTKNLLVETLKEMRFLHDIPAEYLEHIADLGQMRDYDELDTIFREGEIAQSIYLVVYGNVSLEMCAPAVGCRRILTVGPGDLLSWSALLEQTRLTATARPLTLTRLVQIDAAKLLNLCERHPDFGYELMRRTALALAKRLSGTRMQLLDVYGSNLPAIVQSEEE